MRFTKTIVFAAACALLASEQAKPPKDEGIKVHGHWVLEIRNRDGSVASRREFDNSLATGPNNGGGLIAAILAGPTPNEFAPTTVGPWFVQFSSGNNAVLGVTDTQVPCGYPCSSSLTVSSSTGQLVFQGATALATAATTVDSVSTIVGLCGSLRLVTM
jgi:hypothetical protein